MRAGQLRHKIDIQQVTLGTADANGEQAETWSAIYADVPAEVRVLFGNEAWKAQQVQPEATLQVLLRYNEDITTAVRFKFGSVYLYPLSVTADVKNRQQVCMCRQKL